MLTANDTQHTQLPAHPLPREWARAVPLLLLMAIHLLLWFAGISHRPLGEPDEGRYAEVPLEMLIHGDWISPTLDGYLFMDKPPMQYWATALAYELFGINPFSARLWSVLTGLVGMISTGWLAGRLYGWKCGILAGSITGSSLLYVIGAHTATTDMGVAAFITAAIACFCVAEFTQQTPAQRRTYLYAGWIALALAVLCKGLIGLVLPGLSLAIYMLWQRQWMLPLRLMPWKGSALLLVIAVPWFALMQWRHPEFFHYFFIREHFTRFLTSRDHRDHPWWYFVPIVAAGLMPWSILVNPAPTRRWLPADRFLLCWAGVTFSFFSLSHSKLPFYILPVLPPLAIMLARGALRLNARQLRLRLTLIAALNLLLALGIGVYAFLHTHHSTGLFDAAAARNACLAPSILAAGGLACVYGSQRWSRLSTLVLLSTTALLAWQTLMSTQDRTLAKISSRPVADLLRPYQLQGTRIYSLGVYLRGLPFYLGTPVIMVDPRSDDLLPGVRPDQINYLPNLASFEQRWKLDAPAVALVSPGAMQRLRQDRLPMQLISHTHYGDLVGSAPVLVGGRCQRAAALP
ncbi:phospholipid carrier-dependent glycosyltransferase [Frateuria aurantia]